MSALRPKFGHRFTRHRSRKPSFVHLPEGSVLARRELVHRHLGPVGNVQRIDAGGMMKKHDIAQFARLLDRMEEDAVQARRRSPRKIAGTICVMRYPVGSSSGIVDQRK